MSMIAPMGTFLRGVMIIVLGVILLNLDVTPFDILGDGLPGDLGLGEPGDFGLLEFGDLGLGDLEINDEYDLDVIPLLERLDDILDEPLLDILDDALGDILDDILGDILDEDLNDILFDKVNDLEDDIILDGCVFLDVKELINLFDFDCTILLSGFSYCNNLGVEGIDLLALVIVVLNELLFEL